VTKGQESRHALIRNDGELQIFVNGEFVSGRRYLSSAKKPRGRISRESGNRFTPDAILVPGLA
jgi:hypothetical protein